LHKLFAGRKTLCITHRPPRSRTLRERARPPVEHDVHRLAVQGPTGSEPAPRDVAAFGWERADPIVIRPSASWPPSAQSHTVQSGCSPRSRGERFPSDVHPADNAHMARKLLVDEVTDRLLDEIIDGTYPPGSSLPAEMMLAADFEVSRVTVRAATKALAAQGIVRTDRGVGSTVAPLNRWTSITALLRVTASISDYAEAGVQLVQLRRMLECGAAELAAHHIQESELRRLGELVDVMTDSHHEGDIEGYVEADLAFHEAILEASRNPFISIGFAPLTSALAVHRRRTSSIATMRTLGIDHHHAIVTALADGDPEASRKAMDLHMQQTVDGLRDYVHKDPPHSSS